MRPITQHETHATVHIPEIMRALRDSRFQLRRVYPDYQYAAHSSQIAIGIKRDLLGQIPRDLVDLRTMVGWERDQLALDRDSVGLEATICVLPLDLVKEMLQALELVCQYSPQVRIARLPPVSIHPNTGTKP